MNEMEYLPVALAVVLVAATMAHRRLYASVQPLRLELAEKGELLLDKRDLPEELRKNTRLLLDTAFTGGWLLFGGIFLYPLLAFTMAVRPSIIGNLTKRLSLTTAEIRALHHEVTSLHDRILLANHPFLWMILHAEIILTLPLMLIVISLLRGKMPNLADRFLILSVLESGEIRFFSRRATA